MDASSEKALFRRGEALFGMKEFDRARDDFQQVVRLYPANKAAKSQVCCHLSDNKESTTQGSVCPHLLDLLMSGERLERKPFMILLVLFSVII